MTPNPPDPLAEQTLSKSVDLYFQQSSLFFSTHLLVLGAVVAVASLLMRDRVAKDNLWFSKWWPFHVLLYLVPIALLVRATYEAWTGIEDLRAAVLGDRGKAASDLGEFLGKSTFECQLWLLGGATTVSALITFFLQLRTSPPRSGAPGPHDRSATPPGAASTADAGGEVSPTSGE